MQHCFNHTHPNTHTEIKRSSGAKLSACPRAAGLGQEVRLQNRVTPLSRLDPETGGEFTV